MDDPEPITLEMIKALGRELDREEALALHAHAMSLRVTRAPLWHGRPRQINPEDLDR